MLDKDQIKNSLSINQIFDFLSEYGGEPIIKDSNTIISKTICHNAIEEINDASYKLYYYDNTHLFHCYTGCAEPSFDIYDLMTKIKNINGNDQWKMANSVFYIAEYFGYSQLDSTLSQEEKVLPDWKILKDYDKINLEIDEKQIVELKIYDERVLRYLPRPHILNWEREGITKQAMQKNNICYDPLNQGIVIPHYNIENQLIGIRERTLIKDKEVEGKYRPAFLNGQLYNHPLGFNLYNINNSKNNIKLMQKAIIFESEKSTLLMQSYFPGADISVACCGSNLTNYQFKLLLSLGVNEISIAFDRQFKKVGDEEFKRWTKKLESINNKYKGFCRITFLFDKKGLLNYKDSPIDCGPDIFMKLYTERIAM